MSHRAQLKLFSQPPAAASLPSGTYWRTVTVTDQSIGFTVQRSRRRTIGFLINDAGLKVTAPTWATFEQIDTAVIARHSWILDKLHLRQQHLEHQALADTLWKRHGHIPYMGVHIELDIDASHKTTQFEGQSDAPKKGDRLFLALPDNADHQRIQDSVHAWLQRQASWWFEQRLNHFLMISGQTMHSWRLSSATTRWGSCSSARRIMLNWRLIHFRHTLIDYVIAHEVAHLREMNHSPAFWHEVKRLMPDFVSAQAELKRHRPGVLPLI